MRITDKVLQELVGGSDLTIKSFDGQHVCAVRENERGAFDQASPTCTKRELYYWLRGYFHGHEQAKKEQAPTLQLVLKQYAQAAKALASEYSTSADDESRRHQAIDSVIAQLGAVFNKKPERRARLTVHKADGSTDDD